MTRARLQRTSARWWTGPSQYPYANTSPAAGLKAVSPVSRSFGSSGIPGSHPLAEPAMSAALAAQADRIRGAFAGLASAVEELAPLQYSNGFEAMARSRLAALGDVSAIGPMAAAWNRPIDWVARHAELVIAVFARLVADLSFRPPGMVEGEPASTVMRRWGFHAVDIATCADGRMAGLLDFAMRLPLSIVSQRRSYAGAMFPVDEAVSLWERTELKRMRSQAAGAIAGTRYLKIGVYHFSSRDPHHEGCAAHGSDDRKAAGMLLARLDAFREAIERRHGAGKEVVTLLVGQDTDTDSLRIHVPNADGGAELDRYVCARALHDATSTLAREEAKDAVRRAVAESAGVAADDPATEGIRWLCGYLIKNNISQVAAVRSLYANGSYPDAGHDEKLIVFGDPINDVQLRNLAFQAQAQSVEQSAGDLAIGVKILGERLGAEGLAVPVLVVRNFDPDIPGHEAEAERDALRMRAAVHDRFPLGQTPRVHAVAAVRSVGGGALKLLNPHTRALSADRSCGCGGH